MPNPDYCTYRYPDNRDYTEFLNGLQAANICMFCPEGIARELIRPVYYGRFWYLVHNFNPAPGTRAHMLAIPYLHVAEGWQLPPGAADELEKFFRRFKIMHGVTAASKHRREGPPILTCASVGGHLHEHFMAGSQNPEDAIINRNEMVFHGGYKEQERR